MLQLIDSHAHLTYSPLYEEIDTVLERAEQAGVCAIVNICTNQLTLERGLSLAKRYPWIFNAASTTPHDVDKEGELLFPLMSATARAGNLVAVGETGLDYHYDHSPKETQRHFLRQYLYLALECRLPVVIHCREAFADLMAILKSDYREAGRYGPGVLHCFTGSVKEAEALLEIGWMISLSGIVTFTKSQLLREVAKIIPQEQLLIETDTPFLAPQSKRGRPNEPAFLREIAQIIANEKELSLEELANVTAANCRRFFSLKLKV